MRCLLPFPPALVEGAGMPKSPCLRVPIKYRQQEIAGRDEKRCGIPCGVRKAPN